MDTRQKDAFTKTLKSKFVDIERDEDGKLYVDSEQFADIFDVVFDYRHLINRPSPSMQRFKETAKSKLLETTRFKYRDIYMEALGWDESS